MYGKRYAVLLLLFICSSFPALNQADACSLPGNEEHVLDPQEQQVDTTPPGIVEGWFNGIFIGADFMGGGGTCSGLNFVELIVTPPDDDRTGPEQMGYLVEYLSGNLPDDSMSWPVGPIRSRSVNTVESQVVEQLYIHWRVDPPFKKKSFDFVVTVKAMDLGGNLGEASEPIRIKYDTDTGCSTGGAGGLLLVWLLFGFGLLRRSPLD